MSFAAIARSPALRQQIIARAHGFHFSAPARSASHGEYHHLPFQFPGNRKLSFGLKVAAYLSFGFSIPFLASYYQIQKSKGA